MLKPAITMAVMVTLSACAVGPDYRQPQANTEATFTAANTASFNSSPVTPQFWNSFNDATLAQLVNDALLANHDLRIALANLNASRAIHRLSRFDLAPTVTAGAGYTEQLYAKGLNSTREVSYYDASIDAVWELDVFGRARRNLERSRAEVQAAEANLQDAQVMVTAEVTRTYFELRGQQQQLSVARRNVQNQGETVDLTRVRLDAGRATELDTSRAQALLSSSNATIAPLQAAVARSIHRLSVLTGRGPNALTELLTPSAELPVLPEVVAVSDPATLLRQRPDIRVAERELAASTAAIGVAVADLFPRVTFTGSVGVAAINSSGLGDAGSGTRLVAPGISWAAFDLGRVKAQIAATRFNNQASLAHYEQTVLQALEETENALVTHAQARERLQYLTESAAASSRAAELARIRYENGVIDFLQVLDAERSLLQAEDQLAQSRTETATSLVAVYKALGGGWADAPLPR
ncbi:MAG: efflux transporter outer membrane subunit [Steroidobacteraceae bacterium]